jgi:hypothetical protein
MFLHFCEIGFRNLSRNMTYHSIAFTYAYGLILPPFSSEIPCPSGEQYGMSRHVHCWSDAHWYGDYLPWISDEFKDQALAPCFMVHINVF